MRNPYEILGIEQSATADDIKRAFRRLARAWHPDVRPPEQREAANEKMEELNAAYQWLSDPQQRRDLDATLGTTRCFDHSDRVAVARCSVCETGLCQDCAFSDGSVGQDGAKHFCSGHRPETAYRADPITVKVPRVTKAARAPCWLHFDVASVCDCTLCAKPLCMKCASFLGSDRYCQECLAAAQQTRRQQHIDRGDRMKSREQEAIRARQRLRNLTRPSGD